MTKVTKLLAGVKHIKANKNIWEALKQNSKRDKKISFAWNDAIKKLSNE